MITVDQARTIVDHALRYAREQSLAPMTVAVLDGGGQLVAFAREDNSSLLREKIARGKAMGALNMGAGSAALARRAEEHPHFIASAVALADGNLVPVAGGVLIRALDGLILGAVGVSGAVPPVDEACALAGIASVELVADAG